MSELNKLSLSRCKLIVLNDSFYTPYGTLEKDRVYVVRTDFLDNCSIRVLNPQNDDEDFLFITIEKEYTYQLEDKVIFYEDADTFILNVIWNDFLSEEIDLSITLPLSTDKFLLDDLVNRLLPYLMNYTISFEGIRLRLGIPNGCKVSIEPLIYFSSNILYNKFNFDLMSIDKDVISIRNDNCISSSFIEKYILSNKLRGC